MRHAGVALVGGLAFLVQDGVTWITVPLMSPKPGRPPDHADPGRSFAKRMASRRRFAREYSWEKLPAGSSNCEEIRRRTESSTVSLQ
jgi:hypothetical protein